MQPIYKETSVFSSLFFETIKADMKEVEAKNCEINPSDLLYSRLAFEALGLLYVLIHDQILNSNMSVKDRFIRWCTLSQVTVPKLNFIDFQKKLRGN